MRALIVEPEKKPYTKEIPNELKALQQVVGGYIETLYLGDAILVCNEEGKIFGLPPNRWAGHDLICGTFLIVGDDGEEFCGLTVELNDSPLEVNDIGESCMKKLLFALTPPKEPKQVPRKSVDMGKILALRKAGWSLDRIGKEMHVSAQTIANRLAENSSPSPEVSDE